MTENESATAEKKRLKKKTIFAIGVGGLAGFFSSFGLMRLADTGALGDLNASQEIASLVGMIYILTSVAVLFGLASPKAGATFLNVEDAEELREQKSMLMGSGVGMGALGIALIVVALSGTTGIIDPMTALIVYAVLLVVGAVASMRSWKLQDELMRAVGRETGATSFYLLFFVGGSWELLGHLGFVARPAALDWLSMFWALMLLAAFIVCGRRGMMKMR